MKIIFDGRVLKHEMFSGVENYTDLIYRALKIKISLQLFQPKSLNKYMQHFWEHFKLPILASKQDMLFCPANIAPLWLSKKIKLVITLHDVAFKSFPNSVSRFFYCYYSFLIPRNIKRANAIITISEASKKEILHFYPEVEDKIFIIPLGVDPKYKVLRDIKKDKKILYVGSVNERKNIVGVIEAFERLPADKSFILVVVGNFFGNFLLSEKTRKVLNRAILNNNIIFKKNISDEDLIREYNSASCFIFPSFYEGFGLPPLEAMACGTPVITSNLTSMPEVCGDAAVYVDPYDVNDIKDKMEMVLEDRVLQEEMIKRGLEQAKKFTWEKAAQEHIKVFNEVLEN